MGTVPEPRTRIKAARVVSVRHEVAALVNELPPEQRGRVPVDDHFSLARPEAILSPEVLPQHHQKPSARYARLTVRPLSAAGVDAISLQRGPNQRRAADHRSE